MRWLIFKRYVWNILIALDQFANALIGGDPDHTISGRMGRRLHDGLPCPGCKALCWLLGKLDPDHCNKSIEWDEGNKAVWK